MKTIINLYPVTDLRTPFRYNRWGNELIAQLFRETTDETWDNLFHVKVFKPFDLRKTHARGDVDEYDNVGEAYTVKDDGTPGRIQRTPLSGSIILSARLGVKSCIKDLLVLYPEILRAC
jgi:CubicO group peptidase (beta-lactamase class C family)